MLLEVLKKLWVYNIIVNIMLIAVVSIQAQS